MVGDEPLVNLKRDQNDMYHYGIFMDIQEI